MLIGVLNLGYIAFVVLVAKGMVALIYGLIPLIAGWWIFGSTTAEKESPGAETAGKVDPMEELKSGCARIRSFLKSLL